jgi:hypothetical protein
MHFAPIITSCFFLASPVVAQDQQVLAKVTKIQHALSHADLMRSAAAACLMAPKDRKAVLAILKQAGWNVTDDTGAKVGDEEWFEIGHKDVWISLIGLNDDFFCDVQGDISQHAALAVVKDLFTKAQWNDWVITQEDGECHSLTHNEDGIGIYITSDGNDPVCTPSPSSAIRISG